MVATIGLSVLVLMVAFALMELDAINSRLDNIETKLDDLPDDSPSSHFSTKEIGAYVGKNDYTNYDYD